MSREFQAITLALSMIVPGPAAAQAPTGAAELGAGIRQVDEGDLEAAVITLDGVVQRLSGEKSREKDLARAYVYLAVAHLGLGRTEDAKAKLREAWKMDNATTLDSKKFSPRILQLYEEAKQEARAAAPRTGTRTASAPPAAAPEKGGGAGKWLLIGGGVAAVGIGVAVAGGGGGADAPTTPAGPVTVNFPLTASTSITRTFTMSAAGLVSVSVPVGSAFVHLYANCPTPCTDVANTCQPGPCVRSGPNVLQATMPAGTNTVFADACPLSSGCTISVTHPR